jgi:hypothetical protein
LSHTVHGVTRTLRLDSLRRSAAAQALGTGAAAFAAFALLRSRDYGAVDGAVRCLEVFHRQEIFFHGNNHLLYPVDVYLWHRLLAVFGVAAGSPFDYLALTQLMNGLAAAGCVAVLVRLVRLAGAPWWAALGTAALFASSRAVLVHATNSAEPMVGLFWSLLAVLVLARSLPDGGAGSAAASGALFVLALATYQSTILLVPAALVLCLARPGRPVARLAALAAGGLAAAVCLYGPAYDAMGIEGMGAKVRSFLAVGGAPGAFGQPSWRKVVLVPLGLAENLVDILPESLPGIRAILSAPRFPLAAAVALALAAVSVLALVRLRAVWGELGGRERLAFAAGLAGLAATMLGPAVWVPLYDKLWLQPLACWSFLAALAVTWLPSRPKRTAWRAAGAAALVAVLAVNLAWAVPMHRRETPYLAAARQVADLVEDRDLVVHEWDGISVLYSSIWGWSRERHRFDFPTEAVQRGAAAREALDQAVDAARARGGRVYFLGILDMPRSQWDVFLGDRAGLPYDSLAPYRAGARTVAILPYQERTIRIYLWEGPRG